MLDVVLAALFVDMVDQGFNDIGLDIRRDAMAEVEYMSVAVTERFQNAPGFSAHRTG